MKGIKEVFTLPEIYTLIGNEEIQVALAVNPILGDFCKLYIDDEITDHLMRQGNLCIQQYIQRKTH